MDHELVRALSHPIRLEIIEVLQGQRIASPAEISAEIGQSPSVVSYHASTLVRCGCLELVHSRPRRGGGIENFFGIAPDSIVGFQPRRPPHGEQAPESD
ncbi:MAG TPA: ArsR family transcriptional regulator [Solirubrobacterales bacterium]|nr:ArsR family transcriptional regulator [Solirubrobacterales bacterium]